MSNTQTYDTHSAYLEPKETETVYIDQHGDQFTIKFEDGGTVKGTISGKKYFLSIDEGSSQHEITITMTSETTFVGKNIVRNSKANWEGHWELEGTKIDQPDLPVADAGNDKITIPGATVQMNGSGSYSHRAPLTFQWYFEDYPGDRPPELSDATIAAPVFIPETEGTYTLGLVVNDGKDTSGTDTVTVLVMDVQSFSMDAFPISDNFETATDKDGYTFVVPQDGKETLIIDLTSYTAAAGFKMVLFNANGVCLAQSDGLSPLRLKYPFSENPSGKYLLIVESTNQTPADYDVDVKTNTKPVAVLSGGGYWDVSQPVILDGSLSKDSDNHELAYAWSVSGRPNGSTVDIGLECGSTVSFQPDMKGTYEITLVVSDPYSDSDPVSAQYTFIDFEQAKHSETQTMSGAIDTSGDMDAILFSGRQGDVASLYVKHSLPGVSDLIVTIYGPDGTKLISDHHYNNFEMQITIPADGEYSLLVQSEDTSTGTYSLNLSMPAYEEIPLMEDLETTTHTGTIDVPGDTDTVTFNGRSGDRITLYASDTLSGSVNDLMISITNPDGTEFISDHGYDDFQIDVILPQNGLYRIHIDAENDATGSYTLNLSNVNADIWETVPAGKTVTGTIDMAGDMDMWEFTGNAGDTCAFAMSPHLPGVDDLYVTVFNPDGSQLFSENSYRDFAFQVTLSQSGTYTVLIDAEGDGMGTYSMLRTNE